MKAICENKSDLSTYLHITPSVVSHRWTYFAKNFGVIFFLESKSLKAPRKKNAEFANSVDPD